MTHKKLLKEIRQGLNDYDKILSSMEHDRRYKLHYQTGEKILVKILRLLNGSD